MNITNVVKGKKGFVPISIEKRFNSRFHKINGCWEWIGLRDQYGYGSIYHKGRNRKATHVAYELHTGLDFPKGKYACHHCDNPSCVNPDHIFIGSAKDNTIDAMRKGRLIPIPNQQILRTHCKHGHAFNAENTRYNRHGHRECIACKNIRNKNRYPTREALEVKP